MISAPSNMNRESDASPAN